MIIITTDPRPSVNSYRFAKLRMPIYLGVGRTRALNQAIFVKTLHGFETLDPALDASVLSVGNFDGIHVGHQRLLARAGEFAAERGIPLVVLTFDPHPLAIVRPESAPPRLATLDQKLEQLAECGVDITVVAESTPALLSLEPEVFVDRLMERFRPVQMVEGGTFGFGRGRKGTPAMLKSLGEQRGFEVCILEPVEKNVGNETVVVSSSVVRELIGAGKMRHAATCLGRPYTFRGRVEAGEGRGAKLGFPTANIGAISQLTPGDGVYAGVLQFEDLRAVAAISVGVNPTFGGDKRKVEAHLLDFNTSIDGKCVDLSFYQWVRPQRQFMSADDLTGQIAEDIEKVREAVSAETLHKTTNETRS